MAFTKEELIEYRKANKEKLNAKRREQYREAHPNNDFEIVSSFIYGYFKYNNATPIFEVTNGKLLKDNNWSDIYTLNIESIANFLNMNRKKISRIIKKMEDNKQLHYYKSITYNKKPIKCYQLDYSKVTNLDKEYSSPNKVFEFFKYISEKIDVKNEKKLHKNWNEFINNFPFATQYNNEFMKFLHIDEDGNITYGRCYNELCKTRNPDKHEEHPLDRYYTLDKLYGFEQITSDDAYDKYQERYSHYDVNAMSLRTTINIINIMLNKPFAEDTDIYYEVYIDNQEKYNLPPLTYKEFKDSKQREILKIELQSANQKVQVLKTKKDIYLEKNGLINELLNKEIITKDELKTIKLLKTADEVKQYFGCTYDKFLIMIRDAYYKLIRYGEAQKRLYFGKDYFLIESIVMFEIINYFKDKGITVYNTYDELWGNKNELTKDLFKSAYEYAVKNTVTLLSKEKIIKLYIKPYTYITTTDKKTELKQNAIQKINTFGDTELTNLFTEFLNKENLTISLTNINKWYNELKDISTNSKRIESVRNTINNNWFNFYSTNSNYLKTKSINRDNFSGIKNDSITQDEFEKIKAKMLAKKQQKGVM